LKQIRYSHVLAHFKKEDRFVEHDFSIFNEVLIERRASHTDPIVACTIVIADPIIQSLNDKHFTCLNHTLMQELSTIGAAFYMRLFYHFATRYDGHHLDRIVFKKRYDDICSEWLGGITVLKHRSKILGEQLGTHLDALVSLGFLRSYALTPAESRGGFVLTFRPGDRFKEDYRTFYTRRSPGEAKFTFHDENREMGDPHQVAYLFMEKRTGRKPDATAFVSSKEVETAKGLLAQLRRGRRGLIPRPSAASGNTSSGTCRIAIAELPAKRRQRFGNRRSGRHNSAWITISTAARRPSVYSIAFLQTNKPPLRIRHAQRWPLEAPYLISWRQPYYVWKGSVSPSSDIQAVLPTLTSGQRLTQPKAPGFAMGGLTERPGVLTETSGWFDRKEWVV
jgi:hypothetical protein